MRGKENGILGVPDLVSQLIVQVFTYCHSPNFFLNRLLGHGFASAKKDEEAMVPGRVIPHVVIKELIEILDFAVLP